MNAIQLQGIGLTKAKPACEFKAGEKMVWNGGYTSTILSLSSETKAFVTYLMEDEHMPTTYERRLKKSRLVGCV